MAAAPAFQVRWPEREKRRHSSRAPSTACRGNERSATRQWRSSGSLSATLARRIASVARGISPSIRATSTATGSPSSMTGTAHQPARWCSCASTVARVATSEASCNATAARSAHAVSDATHQCGVWSRTSNSVSDRPWAPSTSLRAQAAVRLIHSCAAARAPRCETT